MARIIRKGYQLEEEYYAIKQDQADKRAKKIKIFGKVTVAFIMIYAVSIAVSAATNTFSSVFVPLTVCFGFVQMTLMFAYIGNDASKYVDTDILVSGIHGERIATRVLAALPDSYTIFQNVIVTYGNKESEIDNIVVGKSGVFIIEVKNHNSHIVGDINETYWTQHKVGRGGTPYTNQMYNPVRQVGTHIYCLANYLRQNGVNIYIEGMVYFVNQTCLLDITGDSDISVYSSFEHEEELLCRQILSGNYNLDSKSINRICKLLHQL